MCLCTRVWLLWLGQKPFSCCSGVLTGCDPKGIRVNQELSSQICWSKVQFLFDCWLISLFPSGCLWAQVSLSLHCFILHQRQTFWLTGSVQCIQLMSATSSSSSSSSTTDSWLHHCPTHDQLMTWDSLSAIGSWLHHHLHCACIMWCAHFVHKIWLHSAACWPDFEANHQDVQHTQGCLRSTKMSTSNVSVCAQVWLF